VAKAVKSREDFSTKNFHRLLLTTTMSNNVHRIGHTRDIGFIDESIDIIIINDIILCVKVTKIYCYKTIEISGSRE